METTGDVAPSKDTETGCKTMKITSPEDLAAVFLLMGTHGISRLELEGFKAVRNTRVPAGGYIYSRPEDDSEKDSGGSKDDEDLLFWSAGN